VVGLQYFPANLTVEWGDTVVFSMSDPNQLHTVTFLSDGPESEFVVPLPQAAGPPKLLFPASIVQPQAGNVYSGSGLFHSGFMQQAASAAALGATEWRPQMRPSLTRPCRQKSYGTDSNSKEVQKSQVVSV
jgi:hypothetical protein